jgi:hypothetical protein
MSKQHKGWTEGSGITSVTSTVTDDWSYGVPLRFSTNTSGPWGTAYQYEPWGIYEKKKSILSDKIKVL